MWLSSARLIRASNTVGGLLLLGIGSNPIPQPFENFNKVLAYVLPTIVSPTFGFLKPFNLMNILGIE